MRISRPTLLINEQTARRNIVQMREKAKKGGVVFRPHFKTHQSSRIGNWFREYGIDRISVSSVEMAGYFARSGWNNITIAFPVNIREMATLNRLSKQIRIQLLVESEEVVEILERRMELPVNLWIKVDAGYHRTGISADDTDRLINLAKQIQSGTKLHLEGILTHAGQSYSARGKEKLISIYQESTRVLSGIKRQLQTSGISPVRISYGDTPTCSVVDSFQNVDEIRPGNFVFYDIMQLQIGSCGEEDIAVALLCPVVARHPERGEIVVHGGAVHLSKEFITRPDGQKSYGAVAEREGNQWGRIIPDCFVSALSQEHGIIKVTPDVMRKTATGDLITIVPVHSCLTMNLMRKFRVV